MGGQEASRFRGAALPQVNAQDFLPTAAVIMAAKTQAARVCGARAADVAWPNIDAAKAWIDLIPVVALGALGELCPLVVMGRLARCVGLDPLDGPDQLNATRGPILDDAIAEVVAFCGAAQ